MISERVLELLRNVPKGKVTTYKALAERTGTSPRAVGRIMKGNKRPDYYPCYKVVRSDGSLGGYTHPRGLEEKIRRLEMDGIAARNMRINKKHFHQF